VGVVDLVKIFFTSNLIIVQNLAVVSHTVCVHLKIPLILGKLGTSPLRIGSASTPQKHSCQHLCYRAKFGHSRSNDTIVITESRQKKMTLRFPPFMFKVI